MDWSSGKHFHACVCLLFALAMAGFAQTAAPGTNTSRRLVFLLESYPREAAPLGPVAAGLHEQLRRRMRLEWPGQIASMHMTETRRGEQISPDAALEKFRQRLPWRDVVLVVAVGDPAARLIAEVRDEAFPGVPLLAVACSVKTKERLSTSNTVIIAQQLSIVPAVSNILSVLPATTNIAVVIGNSEPEQIVLGHFGHESGVFTNRVHFPLLRKLHFDTIESECARLPPQSAILYTSFALDGDGFNHDYDFALDRLLSVANAPVFTLYESCFGDRVVGGPMLPDTTLGVNAADVAMRILKGEKPESIAPPAADPMPPVYDGRELVRWQIDEKTLPSGSTVLFRPPSLWHRYRFQLAALGAGLVAQTVLIVALLLNRRKLAESRRELSSRERLADMAEHAAQMGFWVWDIAKGDVWASRSFRAIHGYGAGETLNIEKLTARVLPEDRATRQQALDAAVNGGGRYEAEFRLAMPDGSVRWVGSRGMLEGKGRGLKLSGVSMDITARKAAARDAHTLRDELAHVTRVASAGELAASFAHELNQPLAAIVANTDAAEILARGAQPDMAEIQNILDDIRRDGIRAGDTIHRIRGFLQRRESVLQPVDVEDLVRECVKFIEMDAMVRRVALEYRCEPNMSAVLADRIQLQQVLINLCVNGMDAMNDAPKDQRRLLVTARQVSADLNELAVADRGRGIPPEIIKQVFEPFFTTKSGGLGMGLAISCTIVEAHGGRLWLENNPSGGATARFTVPIAARVGQS